MLGQFANFLLERSVKPEFARRSNPRKRDYVKTLAVDLDRERFLFSAAQGDSARDTVEPGSDIV